MNNNPLERLKDSSLLRTDGFVDGSWIAGASRFAVTDPATGQEIASVAQLGAVDCRSAITAADQAWQP